MSNVSILTSKPLSYGFSSIVLFLSVFALVFEILPEMSAKMIVVPTLVILIGYIIFNIVREKKKISDKSYNNKNKIEG